MPKLDNLDINASLLYGDERRRPLFKIDYEGKSLYSDDSEEEKHHGSHIGENSLVALSKLPR